MSDTTGSTATPPITIDDVVAAMNAEDTVINSAIAFIVSVPGLVANAAATAGLDQAKAAALVADMQNQTNAVTAALVSGTPQASTPTAPILQSMKSKIAK